MSKAENGQGAGPKEVYYEEYARLLFPYLGWPNWPPKETPGNKEWWKAGTIVLPSSSRASYSLPYTPLIEIDGLPKSGKSRIRDELSSSLTNSLDKGKWSIVAFDETPLLITKDAVFADLTLIYPPDILPDDDPVPVVFEKDDWVTTLYYQHLKSEWWGQQIQHLAKPILQPKKHKLVLGYRGPTDGTIFSWAFASHRQDSTFAIPDDLSRASELLLKSAVNLELVSHYVDAVILVGISQQEAQKRRAAEKKDYPGWITDSPFYQDLSSWYGYWIENVWPKMHKRYGTGLLVVDGRKPLEHNVPLIAEYVTNITKSWV